MEKNKVQILVSKALHQARKDLKMKRFWIGLGNWPSNYDKAAPISPCQHVNYPVNRNGIPS